MKPFSIIHKIVVSIALALFSFISLYNLGNAALWDDEAQVGIIARNLVKTGALTGWDGRNLYWYRNGSLLDHNLIYQNPPLDVIAVAGMFKIFGIHDWAVRLPFALAGIASVVVMLFVLRRQFPQRPLYAVYAFLPFALNTQYLLFSRTGRYYTLSTLLFLLTTLCCQRYLEKRRLADGVGVAVTSILAFYSSYLFAAISLIALAAMLLLFHRKELSARDLPVTGLSFLLLLSGTIPYALTYHIWRRGDLALSGNSWWHDHWRLILWNIRDLNETASLSWMAGLFLALMLFVGRKNDDEAPLRRATMEWASLVFAYLVVLGLVSPQSASLTKAADLRYFSPIIPFACGLSGLMLATLHKRFAFLAGIFLVVMTMTNSMTLLPKNNAIWPYYVSFHQLLPDLITEVTQPYPTANMRVAQFIRSQAKQDDVAMTIPFFEAYPLMFYAGDKVVLCQLPVKNFALKLPPNRADISSKIFNGPPDWIVEFGGPQSSLKYVGELTRRYSRSFKGKDGKWMHREYQSAGYIRSSFYQGQRPELDAHVFGPVDAASSASGVFIFHAVMEPGVFPPEPSKTK